MNSRTFNRTHAVTESRRLHSFSNTKDCLQDRMRGEWSANTMYKNNSRNRQTRHNRKTVRDEMTGTSIPQWGPEDNAPPEYECLLCEQSFEVGKGGYPVRPIRAWADALMCDICRGANWDGIVPGTYPKLEAHFAKHGIKLAISEQGRLPIPDKHR